MIVLPLQGEDFRAKNEPALAVCDEFGRLVDADAVDACVEYLDGGAWRVVFDWASVLPSRFDRGCYAAAFGGQSPYEDPGEITAGLFRWIFRYKPASSRSFATPPSVGADYVYVERYFFLAADAQKKSRSILGNPVAVREALGVSESRLSWAAIVEALDLWSSMIERVARQRFRLYRAAKPLRVDRNRSRILHLDEPVRLLSLVDSTGYEFDVAGMIAQRVSPFAVYGVEGDERFNPRIEFLQTLSTGSIFTPSSLDSFLSGITYTAIGLWGFVDPETLDAPIEINEAANRGAVLSLKDALRRPEFARVGPVTSETTDGHSISFGMGFAPLRSGMLAYLRDPAIRDAVRLYTGPVKLRSPGG